MSYFGGDKMAQKGPVEFKGKLNGLYLNLDPDEDFDIIMAYLMTLLKDRASFYQGSRIIGIKGKRLSYKQKAAIETLIYDQYGITVESLEEPEEISPIVEASPKRPVEDVISEETKVVQPEPIVKDEMVNYVSDTHFVFGTMRSGKSVHYPGHVIVIGDVNPGAEIVAEGNIIVMGRVLGFIHAGSAGNDKAIVIANLLKPTQIRISTYISVPPSDDESFHTTVPEKATVSNGVIKIEKCH
jgi:septum site-determining protein MinC